ncbi:unnamed protein product [Heterobilharzia americana]|nr:unnamed protein product [Heterobilharzia americana]
MQITFLCNREEFRDYLQIFKLFVEILADNDEECFSRHVRPILLPLVLEHWLKNFSCHEFTPSERLCVFPWRCWGIQSFQHAKDEFSLVLGRLALTTSYESTIELRDVVMISPHLKSHIPELAGFILIHAIIQKISDSDDGNNNKRLQWDVITHLCGGPELVRATLVDITNLCRMVHSIIEACILYNMPAESSIDGSSQSLPRYHYIVSILKKALAILSNNLNYNQTNHSFSLTDDKQCNLKHICSALGLSEINPKLVSCLYQVGVAFLCSGSTCESYCLIPYCKRLLCWCAISDFIIALLFDVVSFDSDHMMAVREFAIWLLVTGHLTLLASELTRTQHFGELLDSLYNVIVRIDGFPLFEQSSQLLIGLHHSTIYTLNNLAKYLSQQSQSLCHDESIHSPLRKILSILKLLVADSVSSKFDPSVAQLFDFPKSSDMRLTAFFQECQSYVNSVSKSSERSFYQFLSLFTNDLELKHTIDCPQLLTYPVEIFKEMSVNVSYLCSAAQINESAFKSNILIQQIKSVLMRKLTKNKYAFIGLLTTSMDSRLDGGDTSEVDLSYITGSIVRLEKILNPSTCERWLRQKSVPLFGKVRESALLCFSILNQFLSSENLSSLKLCDPTARIRFLEVSEVDDTLNPMFDVKQQILLTIMRETCVPNSLSSLSASKVLHELFSHCPTVITPLLTYPKESQFSVFLRTILAPYIQTVDFSCHSAPSHYRNTSSLSEKLDKAKILKNLPVLINELQKYMENSLKVHNKASFQSWLMDFVHWFLDSGLTQDEFLLQIKPFLRFSFELAENVCCVLIACYLVRVGSNRTLETNLYQFTTVLCDGISNCLAMKIKDPLPDSLGFQKLWMKALSYLNCFIQWMRRCGEKVNVNSTIATSWLTCAEQALALKRPSETFLFLELAWLNDDCLENWVTTNGKSRHIWVNLCHLTGDLTGLVALQSSFTNLNDSDENSRSDIRLVIDKTKITIHELLGDWDYLLSYYDKFDSDENLPSSSANIHPKLALCLQRLGVNRLFEKFNHNKSVDLSGDSHLHSALQETRLSTLWRLGRWDDALTDTSNLSDSSCSPCPPINWKRCGLETTFYWLLQAASQSDWCRVVDIVTAQSEVIVEQLYSDSLQFLSSDHLLLCGQKIGFLSTLNQLGYHLAHDHDKSGDHGILLTLNLLCQSLNSINFSSTCNSQCQVNTSQQSTLVSIEPFLTLSTSFIGVLLSKNLFPDEFRSQLSDMLVHTYLYFAETASSHSSTFHLVKNWLDDAVTCQKRMHNMNGDQGPSKQLEYALQNLRRIKLQSCLERKQGDFDLSVSRLQSGLRLVNEAIALAQRLSVNLNASAYATLAKYCDAQFTALDAYLTSSEFAARRNFLKQAQKNVVDLSNLGEQSRLLRLLQRQSALEDIELTALKKDADHFLEAAVDAYAKSLPLSDDHDLTIFRLISLWLSANSSPYPERRENVNKVLSEQLTKIEAHKFLPLVPQLVARLSTNSEGESSFQTILTKLIIRIVDMHPHHSAFAILFLINAELDYFYSQTPKSSGRQLPNPTNSSKVYKQQINEASVGSSCRKTAALKVFDQLCRGRRGELLRQMQRLAQAYIDLANTKVDKYKTNADSIPLPTGCELYRLISLGSHSSHRAGIFNLDLLPCQLVMFL